MGLGLFLGDRDTVFVELVGLGFEGFLGVREFVGVDFEVASVGVGIFRNIF